MASLIRSLLMEQNTEEVTLPEAPVSAPVPGSSMSPKDFTPAPPMAAQSMGMSGNNEIPTMPTGQGGPMTIQKEVINKELVLSITDELKSVVNTYQKKFESEDMTVDVGAVYLKNFLDALAYSANKIAALMGVTEEPLPEEELPQEPTAAPEASVEPLEPIAEPPEPPAESMYTPGEGEAPEASPFTSPTEAI